MKKTIIVSALAGLILGLGYTQLFSPPTSASLPTKTYINLSDMRKEIDRLTKEDPTLGLSSNPYAFIKDNKEYERIVNMGYPALPVIEERIMEGNSFGLDKYILAAAAEEIARVDLKKSEFQWSDPEEFTRSWKLHLKAVPGKVEKIVNSKESAEWKNEKLTELGAPAIPFILEKVEKGAKELEISLQKIVNPSDLPSVSPSDFNAHQWKTDHKEDARLLKTMVDKAAEQDVSTQFRMNKNK
ncbi:hypothetical protein P4H65_09715 [Paenibacillus chitinolyticus]|uniref:hypothetical protein n=1 Tax=Paenibacillus chitinolyticus TaxID=79263 RepID=UPI002DB60E3A|nr:hypothetical protein [Paenibacillus chitinolyticus]MEC0246060.1 hypothetical protein [Paenibacillus chitinolyticus]